MDMAYVVVAGMGKVVPGSTEKGYKQPPYTE